MHMDVRMSREGRMPEATAAIDYGPGDDSGEESR